MTLDLSKLYPAHLELVESAAHHLEERFTGRNGADVIGSRPQDTLSMGTLAPEYKAREAAEDDQGVIDFFERQAPSSMGYDFFVRADQVKQAKLEIEVTGAMYQAIVPGWPAIRDHIEKPRQGIDGEKAPKLRVDRFARRYNVASSTSLEISLSDVLEENTQEYSLLDAELAEVQTKMAQDPDRMRKPKYGASDLKLPSIPESEEDYRTMLDEALTGEEITLKPAVLLDAMVVPHPDNDDLLMVRVRIRNTGQRPKGKAVYLHEPFFFDVNVETRLKGATFETIDSEAVIHQDFRYDPSSRFRGHNTNVRYDDTETISFDHFPRFYQESYEHRTLSNQAVPRFGELAKDPMTKLEALLEEMKNYRTESWSDSKFDSLRASNVLPQTASLQRYQSARDAFDLEIERFEHGIGVLQRHEDVREAFQLMNASMLDSVTDLRTGKPKFDSWRTFQIVYVVFVIADLASRQYNDAEFKHSSLANGSQPAANIVDVLWFPTGGGKTETYLGIILWNAWWDRIRGKHFGTTAWAKFPLRFLSLQQQGRFLSVVMHANARLRAMKGQGRFPKAEIFSVGYFVGGRNTPNRWTQENLIGDEEESILDIARDNDEKRRDWNVVPVCPLCKSSTTLEPDKKHARIRINCPKEEHGELPVYIVDQEIYRYTPTILLGTLDKMAVMSHNFRFRRIFLGEEYRCSDHGYTRFNKKEGEPVCEIPRGGMKCTAATKVHGLVDAGPTLLLQDELHLLEANLGSFEAHYEGFIDHYQRRLLPKIVDNIVPGSTTMGPWKILGATATIKGYQDQVWKLYLREAARFPNPGPTRFENFYAETKHDKTRRIFASFRPNNMPTPTAVKETLAALQSWKTHLIADPSRIKKIAPSASGLTDDECMEVVDNFVLSLSYHLARAESTSVDHWWGVNIPRVVERAEPSLAPGHKPLCEPLTGDTPFYDVVSISRQLDIVADARGKHIGHVPATKMVSHGVDISRLNLMVFDGMPRSHAEYIQSGSRAGRTWPGLVVNVINTKRTRDLSHYEFHADYHERLDLHVEHVAITRWGSRTYEKTVPGLLAALLHMCLAPRRGHAEFYKPAHLKAMLEDTGPKGTTRDEIIQEILLAYGCRIDKVSGPGEGDPEGEIYKREVPQFVNGVLNGVLNKESASNFFEGFSDNPPMRSMRDIEGTLLIQPDHGTMEYLTARFGGSWYGGGAPDTDDQSEAEPSWSAGEEVIVDEGDSE